MIDTLLKRYGGFAPLELFSFSELIGLIDTACENAADELLMLRWVAGGYERTVAFADFRAACSGSPAEVKTADEIHAELIEKFDKFNFVKMGG